MYNLIALENLKTEGLILAELYAFFGDVVTEIAASNKMINLFLTKNTLLLLNFNIFATTVVEISKDFIIQYGQVMNNVIQIVDVQDTASVLNINKSILTTFMKLLISSSLYKANTDKGSIKFDTTESFNLDAIDEVETFIEAAWLNNIN